MLTRCHHTTRNMFTEHKTYPRDRCQRECRQSRLTFHADVLPEPGRVVVGLDGATLQLVETRAGPHRRYLGLKTVSHRQLVSNGCRHTTNPWKDLRLHKPQSHKFRATLNRRSTLNLRFSLLHFLFCSSGLSIPNYLIRRRCLGLTEAKFTHRGREG